MSGGGFRRSASSDGCADTLSDGAVIAASGPVGSAAGAGAQQTGRSPARSFGAGRIGIMGAWITVIHQIGSASAAHLAGLLRIDCGTYVDVSDTSCGRPFNGVLDP